jgi:hypothetical protein
MVFGDVGDFIISDYGITACLRGHASLISHRLSERGWRECACIKAVLSGEWTTMQLIKLFAAAALEGAIQE